MSKGKTRQYYRRVLRKMLNRAEDPGRVVHSYGYAMDVAVSKPKYNQEPANDTGEAVD